MLTLEKIANNYFKTNIPLKMTPVEEVNFQQSTICWLCEEPFGSSIDKSCENPVNHEKVRDHDHLTGKYRGAAHNRCNLKCKQKSSSFVPIFLNNFCGMIVISCLNNS